MRSVPSRAFSRNFQATHRLAKLKNRLDAYPKIAAFLDLYLATERHR